MAEFFVGPIMDKLINACFDYLQDEVIWQTGMKEALERLQKLHPMIQSVVFASSEAKLRDQNPALNKWIWQLRDAFDEADDVLDEFEYMKHKEQLARNMEKTKVRSIMNFLFESARKIRKVGERALKIDPSLKRLEEVVQKLDKVSAEVGNFLHLLESTEQEQQEQQLELCKTRETGSLPKNDLIGRCKEKDFVMQWLRKPSNEHQTHITAAALYRNISLLSIVGIGGMGKTTLLQHAYEDEMTKEFDLKMWVCVSNNFDVKRVISDMLESLKKKKPNLESLDALQGSLKSEVMSKKFLLVLDDIWEEEEEKDKRKWENVLAPLAYGSLESKILVTTRMDSVALMIAKVIKKKDLILRLEGLKEVECLELLNSHAFADVENLDDHKKLVSIAGEMVKKLSGSPLAAKVMGGILNSSLDERHWIKVLNNDIGSAELGQNAIWPILRLSYTLLPKHLQNCFAFCCIFPQDYEFCKDDLVRMWIALGFIQLPYIRGETMEDVGARYFNVLVKKSFFDKIKYRSDYKMHDLLHELAQSIYAQECFRVMDDEELVFRIPKTTRHLFIKTSNLEVLRKMRKFKNLRSLYIIYNKDNQDFVNVLIKIFKALRSIRLLYIFAPNLKLIPEAIGYLIHLRYLRLVYTTITHLPRSLSNLYHLQFIIYDKNVFSNMLVSYDFLPWDMNNLSNLHYLQLPWDDFPGMHGIGKLTSLQELHGFYVKNEVGYRIGELEYMNDLRQLRIKHLENVKDVEEVCSAKLSDKRNLTNLYLEWRDHISFRDMKLKNEDHYLDEMVLDRLQPHNNLKILSLTKYMGVKSAIWMNKAHLISNLEYIHLAECLEWQTLPPFGQLPFLKSLYLNKMPKVKRLENKFHGSGKDCVFPSLKMLYINKLEALEDWFDAAGATKDDCLFPCLTALYLLDCPNLQELPSFPPKLEKLEIVNTGWKTLKWNQGSSNCCSISKSIPLKTLKVVSCPNMTSLPLADEIVRLETLRNLTIQDCPNLISLGGLQEVETTENFQLILSELVINDPSVLLMVPLRSITSLKKLEIKENDELVSFPIEAEQWFLQVSSSLCELNFIGLKSLQSLPSSFASLSSLNILCVYNVSQLQLLPTIPTSLERLELSHLKSLQCLPSSLSISSLKSLRLISIPLLKSLPDLPPSLCSLLLYHLENLDCLPSYLASLSSLQKISISNVPQLRELPNLPSSLCELNFTSLQSLQSHPSSFTSLSSLKTLRVEKVPQLQLLPNIPASLEQLKIVKLESLHCLPSSLSISSLKYLELRSIPLLKSLPNLPPTLCSLLLDQLENLDCLPTCLPSLSSLQKISISKVPQLRELPNLPPSLLQLSINNCHPELMEHHRKFSGSDWHKIAQIPEVHISNT